MCRFDFPALLESLDARFPVRKSILNLQNYNLHILAYIISGLNRKLFFNLYLFVSLTAEGSEV